MKTFEHRSFGEKGRHIEPTWSCLINPDRNLTAYFKTVLMAPFNKKRFRRPGVFRTLGPVELPRHKGIRCLDMPIKMAGDMDYRIPMEMGGFVSAISSMISFEHAHNSDVIAFNAYLTIDQSSLPRLGETHRNGGLHVDGFQGARIAPKVACDHSYIVADCDPPSIWNQAFESVEDMDDSKRNIFHEFDRTKHYSSEIRCLSNYAYFMDCYAVHSANEAKHYQRTFLRLSYSVREFDRLGNSHNNCFDYDWKMVERDVATGLT